MRNWLLIAAAVAITIALAFDTIYTLTGTIPNKAFVSHTIGVQQVNLKATCARFNVVRAAQNRSELADWYYDTTFLSLVVPKAASTVKQKAPVPKVFVSKLTSAIAAKAWVPVTDCSQHLTQQSLVAPPAIAFNVRLPPPSAL